jgi:hypothetical protein
MTAMTTKTSLIPALAQITFIGWLAIVPALAHAAHAAQEPEYRFTHYERSVTVDDTGRMTTSVTLAVRLLSDAAVQRFSQYMVSYNADLQTLTVDDAQTVHADGTSAHADLNAAVFDRPAPSAVLAPQFSADHLRIIALPATTVGDTIEVRYTLQDRSTLFPEKFTEFVTFAPTEAFDSAEETLDTPADMKVRIDAHGMESVSDTVRDSRHVRIYRYRTPDGGPAPAQAESVSALDTGARLIATNFSDYAELGRVYEQRAQPKSVPSAQIRALAATITGDVTDRRQQAQRIYDWVSRNIRYLAAYVGTGPVVPHSADEILRNGYGDCKDHVALFVALLSAKGIRADNVLVNLGNGYRLPSAPAWYVFNHAITWLPEFGLFADTTDGFAAFGILPFAASDKPALDTATGEMLHTPPQNGSNSTSSIDYTIKIHPAGDADAIGVITLSGQASINPMRSLARYGSNRISYELLKQTGLNGAMNIKAHDRETMDGSFRLDLTSTIDNLAIMPGPAALAIPAMPNYGSIKNFADYVLRQAGEQLDGPCIATSMHEHYRVNLPAEAKIMAIPPDVHASIGEIAYTATYRRRGQTVEIDRLLARNFHTNVCSGAVLEQWKTLARTISTDLHRQILYR